MIFYVVITMATSRLAPTDKMNTVSFMPAFILSKNI